MGLRQLYETNNMISQDDFSLFDPQKMGASVLPDKPSNYIIVLRNTSSLPIKVQISTTPILTSFDYKEEKYNVVYVGKSSKSLRIRDYKKEFEKGREESLPFSRGFCFNTLMC